MVVPIIKERLLIKPEDLIPSSDKFEIIGVLNPGASVLNNGDIILYVRVIEKLKNNSSKKYCYSPRFAGKNKFKIKIDRFSKDNVKEEGELDILFSDGTKRLKFISHLRRVILDKNGFYIKSIEQKPGFFGLEWDGDLGIEDPRITKINDLYIMTYVSLSRESNISTSYAISNDCINWYRRGVIFREQNKDVVIFPEIINKKYVAFHRPEGSFQFKPAKIWIAYSPNLEFWGEEKPIILSKTRAFGKQGAGPPPIKTNLGWLLLYHTIIRVKSQNNTSKKKSKSSNSKENKDKDLFIYSIEAALFDLKFPDKLIAISDGPILNPTQPYEKMLFEDKMIVFPTGIVKKRDSLLIYSGGGDRVVSVKEIKLKDIISNMKFVNNSKQL
ncbi:MAG: hypothetical protein QXJ28_02440 [Candidatus Pacearchaeota archaeon]